MINAADSRNVWIASSKVESGQTPGPLKTQGLRPEVSLQSQALEAAETSSQALQASAQMAEGWQALMGKDTAATKPQSPWPTDRYPTLGEMGNFLDSVQQRFPEFRPADILRAARAANYSGEGAGGNVDGGSRNAFPIVFDIAGRVGETDNLTPGQQLAGFAGRVTQAAQAYLNGQPLPSLSDTVLGPPPALDQRTQELVAAFRGFPAAATDSRGDLVNTAHALITLDATSRSRDRGDLIPEPGEVAYALTMTHVGDFAQVLLAGGVEGLRLQGTVIEGLANQVGAALIGGDVDAARAAAAADLQTAESRFRGVTGYASADQLRGNQRGLEAALIAAPNTSAADLVRMMDRSADPVPTTVYDELGRSPEEMAGLLPAAEDGSDPAPRPDYLVPVVDPSNPDAGVSYQWQRFPDSFEVTGRSMRSQLEDEAAGLAPAEPQVDPLPGPDQALGQLAETLRQLTASLPQVPEPISSITDSVPSLAEGSQELPTVPSLSEGGGAAGVQSLQADATSGLDQFNQSTNPDYFFFGSSNFSATAQGHIGLMEQDRQASAQLQADAEELRNTNVPLEAGFGGAGATSTSDYLDAGASDLEMVAV